MKFHVYFHELCVQNGIMADTIHYPVPVEDVKQFYVGRSSSSSRVLTSKYTVGISRGVKCGYTHDLREDVNKILNRVLTSKLETPLQWRT